MKMKKLLTIGTVNLLKHFDDKFMIDFLVSFFVLIISV